MRGVSRVDYSFYKEKYLGEEIDEAAFPALARRAEAELDHMKQVYAVAPRPGLDADTAEQLAVCAIAEALQEFAAEDARCGVTKVTVGSVSESYAAPAALSAATLAMRQAYYRHEAGYYLRIGRWLPHE